MLNKNIFLKIAACCSGIAAFLHLGCIIFGGDWYRFFGAGEQMALMSEAGHSYPVIVTSVIVLILTIWSLYALSGAGVILRLPFLRLGLCFIAAIYLLRGLAFYPLMSMLPGNSLTFWVFSSTICLVFGLFYCVGIKHSWSYLSGKHT